MNFRSWVCTTESESSLGWREVCQSWKQNYQIKRYILFSPLEESHESVHLLLYHLHHHYFCWSPSRHCWCSLQTGHLHSSALSPFTISRVLLHIWNGHSLHEQTWKAARHWKSLQPPIYLPSTVPLDRMVPTPGPGRSDAVCSYCCSSLWTVQAGYCHD